MKYLGIDCDQYSVSFVSEENGIYESTVIVQTKRFAAYIPKELEVIRTPITKGNKETREIFLNEAFKQFIEKTSNCDCCVGLTSYQLSSFNNGWFPAQKVYELIDKIWDYAEEKDFQNFHPKSAIDLEIENPLGFAHTFPHLSRYVDWKTSQEYFYHFNGRSWKTNNHILNLASAYYLVESLKKNCPVTIPATP